MEELYSSSGSKIEKIIEVDEEQLLSAQITSNQRSDGGNMFTFSPGGAFSNDEKGSDLDSLSSQSQSETSVLNQAQKLKQPLPKTEKPQKAPQIAGLGSIGSFSRKANTKPLAFAEQKYSNQAINEEEEFEGLEIGLKSQKHSDMQESSQKLLSSGKMENNQVPEYYQRDSNVQFKKKERARFQIPAERLERYEDMKSEGKIVNFALAHAPKKKSVTSDNYKQLISSYMKDQEVGLDTKNDNETKMISTEIEQRIKDHITNHKIRANQKYQVVKNFFRIWFINSKEMRRQEKKLSQKSVQNHMVTDKILKTEQENRKKIKFLNEKKPELVAHDDSKGNKSNKPHNGKLYIKPGYDIKMFIPFCTDIYLGKD